MTRAKFLAIFHKCISYHSLDTSKYNTHSFRIGRCTDHVLQGFSNEKIKKIGRWKSNAYLRYVRPDVITTEGLLLLAPVFSLAGHSFIVFWHPLSDPLQETRVGFSHRWVLKWYEITICVFYMAELLIMYISMCSVLHDMCIIARLISLCLDNGYQFDFFHLQCGRVMIRSISLENLFTVGTLWFS